MSPSRLETFADGVFAIAATLLILDVHASGAHLGHQLLHIWPSYAAYAVSFLTIGIMWVNHHTVFEQVGRVDRRVPFFKQGLFLWLAVLALPPPRPSGHIPGGGGRNAAPPCRVPPTTPPR